MHESLILHPESARLSAENARLREELSALLAEAEELLTTTKGYLLALYQARIGIWELRLLEAQCTAARLRREVELIQASLNRGQPPNPREIAGELELEFLAWQEKVRAAAGRVQAAQRRLANLMSEAEGDEFRRLHRALVKRLHPDLHPALTDKQRTLWHRVQAAYQRGDLEELRTLSLLAGDEAELAVCEGVEALRAAQATLKQQITAQLARLEAVQQAPPFNLRAQLEDDAWVERRRGELELERQQAEAQATALRARREHLLSGGTHGTVPGLN